MSNKQGGVKPHKISTIVDTDAQITAIAAGVKPHKISTIVDAWLLWS